MRLAVAAGILLATSPPAPAQTQAPERPGFSQSQTQAVTDFVNGAGHIDNFEIQAGKMAESRAEGADMRDFATMLVHDHAKLDKELKFIVSTLHNVHLPNGLDKANEQKLQQLGADSGQKFEDRFLDQQIQEHERAIKLFRNFASMTQNRRLKQFAENAMLVLQHHLTRAQDLKKLSGAT